jgi:cardiolipin synthase
LGIGGIPPAQSQELAAALAVKNPVESSDLAVSFAPSSGSIELLINGENFYPRILDDIEAAQSSVHVSEFEVRPSPIGSRFVSALKSKAAEGVEVRLVVDRMGSAVDTVSKEMFDDLVSAGVQVVQNDPVPLDRDGPRGGHRPIDWRFDEVAHFDHRKLFVIDGRTAWVGSAGITSHFADGRYHDVFVRTEGDVVVDLQTVFLTSFRFLGGVLPTDPEGLARYYPPSPNGNNVVPITVRHNVPREGQLGNTDTIAYLFENATRRLDVVSPFNADRSMMERLMAAARRGVAVRFVAPASSNNWATAGAFEHYIPELQAAGVEVWLHPVFPHAKVVLADDRVLVGSTNLDAWALYHNWEIGMLIDDAAVAETFRQRLFDVDVARSEPATPATNPLIRAKNWVLATLGPFI